MPAVISVRFFLKIASLSDGLEVSFQCPRFLLSERRQRFLLSEMNRPNSMIRSGSLVKLSPYRSFRPERNNSDIFFSPVQSQGPTDNLCCKNDKGRRNALTYQVGLLSPTTKKNKVWIFFWYDICFGSSVCPRLQSHNISLMLRPLVRFFLIEYCLSCDRGITAK